MNGPGWKPATEPTFRMCPLPRAHCREEQAGEFGERGHVHLDHAKRLGQVGLRERPQVAKTGVVDEDIHAQVGRAGRVEQQTRRGGIGEIGGYDMTSHRREFGRQGAEFGLAACRKDEIVIAREHACQFFPNPGACTSYKGDRSRGGHRALGSH